MFMVSVSSVSTNVMGPLLFNSIPAFATSNTSKGLPPVEAAGGAA